MLIGLLEDTPARFECQVCLTRQQLFMGQMGLRPRIGVSLFILTSNILEEVQLTH